VISALDLWTSAKPDSTRQSLVLSSDHPSVASLRSRLETMTTPSGTPHEADPILQGRDGLSQLQISDVSKAATVDTRRPVGFENHLRVLLVEDNNINLKVSNVRM
jgi:hypothetical protein